MRHWPTLALVLWISTRIELFRLGLDPGTHLDEETRVCFGTSDLDLLERFGLPVPAEMRPN